MACSSSGKTRFFWGFVFTCVALGYLGSKPAEGSYVLWAQIFTVLYFAFFFPVLPLVGILETPRQLPRSITASVLGDRAAVAAE